MPSHSGGNCNKNQSMCKKNNVQKLFHVISKWKGFQQKLNHVLQNQRTKIIMLSHVKP